MRERKQSMKLIRFEMKGKIRSDDPEKLPERDIEILQTIRRIKNDLQPGNGHSMTKEDPVPEIIDSSSEDANSAG